MPVKILNYQLKNELINRGSEFVSFVDISNLPENQNKGFTAAVIFGVSLSAGYLREVSQIPDYVPQMIRNKKIDEDEFHCKEIFTDHLADNLAEYLKKKGYSAYSQSEKNIAETGYYNETDKITPLPHKTIAGLAGMGWIGKHNLLVTPGYGSAISMCTVLTNAPVNTILFAPAESKCGKCTICEDVCSVNAIKGNNWTINASRDELVDVTKCNTCLKCLVFCPWTQAYIKKQFSG